MQPLPHNPLCPYCHTVLTDSENAPSGRSVEHLIPNKVLTKPRTKRDGDFFACRRCNGKKSHIDYVLGVVAMAQSADSQLAAKTLISAVNSNDGRAERFIQMAAEAVEVPGGGAVTVAPIEGNELLDYISYLGRGQYFRKRGLLFSQDTHVMVVDYVNKQVLSEIEAEYGEVHGSNPFSDLQQNKYAETYSEGDCVIYSKNDRYLFLFHSYTAILIEIKRRNAKNIERSRKSAEDLLRHFPYRRTRVV
jgi:hypothetical protein